MSYEAIAIVGFCFPLVHTPSCKCGALCDVLLRIEIPGVANSQHGVTGADALFVG